MYDARVTSNDEEFENIDGIAVSWDGDEYTSEGAVHHVSSTDSKVSVLAVVAGGGYREHRDLAIGAGPGGSNTSAR